MKDGQSERAAETVPALRFKGFTGEWECKKVSELFKITRGDVLPATLTSPMKTKETPYPVYSSQTKDNGLLGYYKKHLYENAITWTTDGANAGTVKYRAGKFYCTNVCGVLLSDAIKANQMVAEVLNRVAKGYVSYGGNPKLMNNVMADIEIQLPAGAAEQEKIGRTFADLDRLIALHRRKVEKLTDAKKALLHKLFPQDGETVPAVRFKGFTGEWEQRKFSDQYEKVSEKNDLSFGADKIISVANMYYKTDTQKSDDDYMRTYNVMRLGDIAFEGHKSKSYSNGRFVENTIGDGIVSHVFDVFRPIREYDLLFWKYLINDEHIMGEILARCTKSTTMMMSLVASDFLKEATLVPSKSEQEKIGAAFEKLDRLIALHRRKVEKLTDAKKALLNKMFPKNKDAGAQIGRDF